MRWSAGLATSEATAASSGATTETFTAATTATPPALLITEILIPDTLQHIAGQNYTFSDWAIGYADDLVGTLVAELGRCGLLESTTLMITSDHGHGTVEHALFSAPDGFAFQARPTGENDPNSVSGPPKYRSTHGFRPGHPDDERFLIVAGPGIEARSEERAQAEDVAATAAEILGMGSFGNGRSLI